MKVFRGESVSNNEQKYFEMTLRVYLVLTVDCQEIKSDATFQCCHTFRFEYRNF